MEKIWYIKLHRQIQESEIWSKPPEWLKIWLYILMEVNFKENWLPIGSKYMTYDEIKLNCKGVTISQIDHAVRWLKVSGMLATQKATRWMVVSVANYSQYQTLENDTKATQKARGQREVSDRSAILYKEERKKERNNTLFDEFYLLYPKHIDKKPASIKFETKVKQDWVEKIMEWLRKWKKKWKDESTELKFIPSPEVWLNKERYNDEIEVKKEEVVSDRLAKARERLNQVSNEY